MDATMPHLGEANDLLVFFDPTLLELRVLVRQNNS